MTKIIIAIFLSFLFFFNTALAESYYFKNCKLTDILVANYLINVDANVFQQKIRNNHDLRDFLINKGKFYCPPLKDLSSGYSKALFSSRKKLLKL